MKDNNFWGNVANNACWMLIGYCVAVLHYVPDINFWKLFSTELLGIFLIWVVCFLLDLLTNWIKNR